MKINYVDRTSMETIREINIQNVKDSIQYNIIPRIDEIVIFGAIRYQVASVIHNNDTGVITINMWKEGFVK